MSTVIRLCLIVTFSFLLCVIICDVAEAQTPDSPDDIDLMPIGGLYHIGCNTPVDDDLDQLCFVRTDLPDVIELGCMDALDGDSPYYMDVSIVATPGIDAEIHCYVTDLGGLVSDYSPNAGVVDFTRPGLPVFIQ